MRILIALVLVGVVTLLLLEQEQFRAFEAAVLSGIIRPFVYSFPWGDQFVVQLSPTQYTGSRSPRSARPSC